MKGVFTGTGDRTAMTFADVLKTYLDQEGASYADVARKMHRSRQWVGRIATGVQVPTNPDTIHELATVVNAPADTLFRAAGKIPPDMQAWIMQGGAMARIRALMED